MPSARSELSSVQTFDANENGAGLFNTRREAFRSITWNRRINCIRLDLVPVEDVTLCVRIDDKNKTVESFLYGSTIVAKGALGIPAVRDSV